MKLETSIFGIFYLVLKWIPAFFLLKNWPNFRQKPIESIVEVIFYPLILTLLQFKNFWRPNQEIQVKIQEFQVVRGCIESSILFIFQVWLILCGWQTFQTWSQFTIQDWKGNVLNIPYLSPLSIFFSFVSILRSILLIETNTIYDLPLLICKIYFSLSSIILSLTFLNNFALLAPIFVLFTNIAARLFQDKRANILAFSMIATLLHLEDRISNCVKTVMFLANLGFVCLVINCESIEFVYDQKVIFGNFQVNLLVASTILTGLTFLLLPQEQNQGKIIIFFLLF